jgi:hypothetical protein
LTSIWSLPMQMHHSPNNNQEDAPANILKLRRYAC